MFCIQGGRGKAETRNFFVLALRPDLVVLVAFLC